MTETLYHGDCIDIMGSLPAESVDMIFADPPFNLGKKYGGDTKGDTLSPEKYYKWCEEWIEEGFRLLKNTGSFYLMTVDDHLPELFPMMKKRGVFVNLIKWKNVTNTYNRKSFRKSIQPILFYGKTEGYKFNHKAQTRRVKLPWEANKTINESGQLLDLWEDIPFVYAGAISHPEAILEPGTNSKAHLAQMPAGLSDRAILFSTDEGDTVLDPFNGSGTTGDSCIKLRRNFIGIERVEKYIRLARDRWDRRKRQPELFYA